MKEILIIYKNEEIIRDRISVSENISEVIAECFEKLLKAGINPDRGQVTVWVGDTHLYIAYRLIKHLFELTVINNSETFNFVVDEIGVYAEDVDGLGYRIDTISDFTQACGIE